MMTVILLSKGRTCISSLVAVFLFMLAAPSTGQMIFDDRCSAPLSHGRFVSSSLELLESGKQRDEIISTLSCIARTDSGLPLNGPPAVRAILALAENDEAIRRDLFEIIRSPTTSTATRRTACDLLVYVANEEFSGQLLAHMEKDWGRGSWVECFPFFRDIGDDAFLRWLREKAGRKTQAMLPESLIGIEVRYQEIQKHVDQMLKYLAGGEKDLDRVWIVRQAMRHGATPAQIRAAALERLRRAEGASLFCEIYLVRECDELGIFEPADESELADIMNFARYRPDVVGVGPQWAEDRIEKRRAQFWRLPPPRVHDYDYPTEDDE